MWHHLTDTSVSRSELSEHGRAGALCTVHSCPTAAALGGYSRHSTSHKAQKTHRLALQEDCRAPQLGAQTGVVSVSAADSPVDAGCFFLPRPAGVPRGHSEVARS